MNDDIAMQLNRLFGDKLTPKQILGCVFETAAQVNVDPAQVLQVIIKEFQTAQSPSIKSLDTLSDYLAYDLEQYYKFRGRYVIEWGWLLWLEKKLGTKAMCILHSPEGGYGMLYHVKEVKLQVEQWVKKSFDECVAKQTKYVVSVLKIAIAKTDGHANALIFDVGNKVLTRFEPHGSVTAAYDGGALDAVLKRWLPTLGSGWKYKAPLDYCPRLGPQSREDWRQVPQAAATRKVWGKDVRKESQGFCAAWSLIYIHYRVANPNATDEQIVKYLDRLTDAELAVTIRKYAEFITRTINTPPRTSTKLNPGDFIKSLPGMFTEGEFSGVVFMFENKPVLWKIQTKSSRTINFGPATIRIPSGYTKITDAEEIEILKMMLRKQLAFPIIPGDKRTKTRNYTFYAEIVKKTLPNL